MSDGYQHIHVRYYVPEEESIYRMAWHICHAMGALDARFSEPGMSRLLGDFLCLLVRMEVARRNAEQLDNISVQG